MKKHLISQQEYYYRVRADCAWKLLALVMNNEPIVYVDETTVSSFAGGIASSVGDGNLTKLRKGDPLHLFNPNLLQIPLKIIRQN